MRKWAIAAAVATGLFSAACGDAREAGLVDNPQLPERELIILAAPIAGDAYYADAAEDIFDFHTAYAAAIKQHDDVLILTDESSYAAYARALGAEHVAVAPMADIWMRDFSLSNAAAPAMFRFSAAGQGGDQDEADAVQEALADLIDDAGIDYRESDLVNDGGNWVDDYAGAAVVSRKFLRDNNLDEAGARKALIALTGATAVAFIDADEQGGLEHADGVVAFIGPNDLVINSYPDDAAYAAALRADLERGLPGVVIHEIVTPYDGEEVYDERFGSACGLYTNMLVTPVRIYFPHFGIPEDETALEQLRSWTDKEIVPVRSDDVCRMGGGVRCMSWQLRGEAAALLRAYFAVK